MNGKGQAAVVAAIIGGTCVAIAVIAGIVSVQLTGGDTGALVRNLGVVAVFLVGQIPTVVTAIRTKQRTEEIATKTQTISDQVNGTLKKSVQNGVSDGIQQAVAQIHTDQQGGNTNGG